MNGAIAVDRPTSLQILQKELGEWFGTMGGVNSNEVEVLSVQSTSATDGVSEREGVTNDRTVLLRFPRSITPQLLTALPLISSSNYRIQLLNDSSDLSRLTGYAVLTPLAKLPSPLLLLSTSMDRKTSYSQEKQSIGRAREVPSPPVSPDLSSDQEEKGQGAASDGTDQDKDSDEGDEEQEKKEETIAKKSLFGLFLLTLAIGGAQIVSSVLSAWGSTYLFELGLTTEVTALIWLGGPLAQVIVQPIVGALSDDEAGRFRRRGWVIGSAIILATSIVYLVHATEFATYLYGKTIKEEDFTMIIAVVSVYILNASLIGLQTGTKTLAIDVAPPSQQQRTSALGNRLSDVCSILAYAVGAYPLKRLGFLDWIGGGQFRKLAYLATAAMIVTMLVTCTTQHEKPEMQEVDNKRIGLIGRIREMNSNLRKVPVQIRRVCYVQIFSWMALFPFLTYSTTYVANIAVTSIQPTPSGDDSARLGSLALVFHQLVCLFTASTIPYLTLLSSNKYFARYLNGPSTLLRRTTARILLFLSARNFWSIGLFVHGMLMMSTFWIKTEWAAIMMVTLMGFPYAVALWAPYALLTEAFLEQKAKARCPPCFASGGNNGKGAVESLDDYNAAMNSDSSVDFDRIPILRKLKRRLKSSSSSSTPLSHRSVPSANDKPHHPTCPEHPNYDPFLTRRPFQKPHSLSSRLLDEGEFFDSTSSFAGLSTTIVTLHNLAMLLPQALVAILAAAAFKFVNARFDSSLFGGETKRDTDEIVWLFRATGILAFIGSVVTRFFGETRWEESVRKRLNVKRWI
ncbi:hypothetical protein JCM5350_005881 [Sporobolomyces pararoseus]